jgi:hypothetical protein
VSRSVRAKSERKFGSIHRKFPPSVSGGNHSSATLQRELADSSVLPDATVQSLLLQERELFTGIQTTASVKETLFMTPGGRNSRCSHREALGDQSRQRKSRRKWRPGVKGEKSRASRSCHVTRAITLSILTAKRPIILLFSTTMPGVKNTMAR